MNDVSNSTAPTKFIETKLQKYAYRRFGKGAGLPLICLQHFTGTLDNWDPAVTDPLATGREVILSESVGVGRSSGEVSLTIPEMARHALASVDALALPQVDVLGYSLGGMVAQEMALQRPSLVRKMVLVGTAPEGGEDIMHMEKSELKKFTDDPNLAGLKVLVKLFFTLSPQSQTAGEAFITRLAQRKHGQESNFGPESCPGSDCGFSRLGNHQRRAVCKAAQDKSAVPSSERCVRQHDSGQKFLHAERAPAQRHAVDLSRRGARFVVSVSQIIRQTSVVVFRIGMLVADLNCVWTFSLVDRSGMAKSLWDQAPLLSLMRWQ